MVQGAQSIYRTVEILDILLTSHTGLLARDVAQKAQLPISTTHRILAVLCEKNLVRQESKSRQYVPGHVWIADCLWEGQRYLYTTYGELPALMVREFGYTAYLHARIGYSYQCLARAEGAGAVQVFSSYQGEIRYLGDGTGSFGIVAFLDAEERETILNANLPLFRKKLLRSEADLHQAIEQSASRGFGFGVGFRVAGTSALSVPIRHKGYVIGALSISGMYDEQWMHQQDTMVERMRHMIEARQ